MTLDYRPTVRKVLLITLILNLLVMLLKLGGWLVDRVFKFISRCPPQCDR